MIKKQIVIDVTEHEIATVVEELQSLEFGDRLTVEMVLNNQEIFDAIFNVNTIGGLMTGDVCELWSNDMFEELTELIDVD